MCSVSKFTVHKHGNFSRSDQRKKVHKQQQNLQHYTKKKNIYIMDEWEHLTLKKENEYATFTWSYMYM